MEKGTLIPILGTPVPSDQANDLYERGILTHSWTTSHYGVIDGNPQWHPSPDGVGSFGLAVSMIATEPVSKKPTCVFMEDYMIVDKDLNPGEELTVFYSTDKSYDQQRKLRGYGPLHDNNPYLNGNEPLRFDGAANAIFPLPKYRIKYFEKWFETIKNCAEELCREKLKEFAPLSPEVRKTVKNVLSTSADTVIGDKYDAVVKGANIRRLAQPPPDQKGAEAYYLDDALINFYIGLLKTRIETKKLKYVVLSTFFVPLLYPNVEYDKLKRWRVLKGLNKIVKLFAPVHWKNEKHWCLMEVDFVEREIRYYDSLSASVDKKKAQQVLENMKKFLTRYFKEEKEKKEEEKEKKEEEKKKKEEEKKNKEEEKENKEEEKEKKEEEKENKEEEKENKEEEKKNKEEEKKNKEEEKKNKEEEKKNKEEEKKNKEEDPGYPDSDFYPDYSDLDLKIVYPKNTPQQEDSVNCGVFMCMFLNFLTDQCNVQRITASDMAYFRERMIWSISQDTLSIPEVTKAPVPILELFADASEASDVGEASGKSSDDASDSYDSDAASLADVSTDEEDEQVAGERSETSLLDIKPNQLYVKKNQCFFDPLRSCGSFVRSKLAYDRKTLVTQARQCGIKYTGVSMNALCAALKNRFYKQDLENRLVKYFIGDYRLPGLSTTLSDKIKEAKKHPEVLFNAHIFDTLIPVPENMRSLHTNSPSQLTIYNTAGLLAHPQALKNYRYVLNTLLKYLGTEPGELLQTLIPNNVYQQCRVLVRLLVSSYILSPNEYNSIKDISVAHCPGIALPQLLEYAKQFKQAVYRYINENYTIFPLDNFFVKFYEGEIPLGFYIRDYTRLNFIQAMTVFPVPEDITKNVKLMHPVQPPPFPTTTSILTYVISHMEEVRKAIETALTDTFKWLALDTKDDNENLKKLQQYKDPFPILQLVGRLWATAEWYGFPEIARRSAYLLTETSLTTLHYEYSDSGVYLGEYIKYIDYVIHKNLPDKIKRSYFKTKRFPVNVKEPKSEYRPLPLMSSDDDESSLEIPETDSVTLDKSDPTSGTEDELWAEVSKAIPPTDKHGTTPLSNLDFDPENLLDFDSNLWDFDSDESLGF